MANVGMVCMCVLVDALCNKHLSFAWTWNVSRGNERNILIRIKPVNTTKLYTINGMVSSILMNENKTVGYLSAQQLKTEAKTKSIIHVPILHVKQWKPKLISGKLNVRDDRKTFTQQKIRLRIGRKKPTKKKKYQENKIYRFLLAYQLVLDQCSKFQWKRYQLYVQQ